MFPRGITCTSTVTAGDADGVGNAADAPPLPPPEALEAAAVAAAATEEEEEAEMLAGMQSRPGIRHKYLHSRRRWACAPGPTPRITCSACCCAGSHHLAMTCSASGEIKVRETR